MAAHKDRKPLFKRLIKAAQRTAEQLRCSENHYFRLFLRTMTLPPWVDYQDENLPSVLNQNSVIAAEFAKRLTRAPNAQEFARIETAFIRRLLNSNELTPEVTKARADSVETDFLVADGTRHAPLL